MRKLVWLLIAAVIGVWGLARFKIGRIECTTQFSSCPDEYLEKLRPLNHQSWVFHPRRSDLAAITSLPEISQVKWQKRLPGTLLVQVRLRSPIGIINGWLVDSEGIAYQKAESSALPEIRSDQNLSAGSPVYESSLLILKTLELLRSTIGVPFSSKLVNGTGLEVKLDSGMIILLNTDNTPAGWNDSLQLIFTRSKIDGKMPSRIDLRFRNPIISY